MKRRSTSDSVRAAVGSSMMSTRALMERALAISTRWRLPTFSVPDLAVHVQVVDVQRGQDLAGPRGHGAPVDDAEAIASAARGVAHEDVLGHGELRVEAQLLVHRGHAGGLGLVGAVEADLLAIDADGAAVRLVHARDDLDERGLAGPVLADEGMDLAGSDREVDVLERADTGERTC